MIDDGVTGLLVPPADEHALASALVRLLTNPELSARLASAGRQRVRERFSHRTTIGSNHRNCWKVFSEVNPALKHLAERALVRSGVERFARRTRRGRTLVLAYHNVLPNGEAVSGDKDLHLPQKEFSLQLDALAETHDVVPIDSIGRASPLSARPRVVITFDDAYMGALNCWC